MDCFGSNSTLFSLEPAVVVHHRLHVTGFPPRHEWNAILTLDTEKKGRKQSNTSKRGGGGGF